VLYLHGSRWNLTGQLFRIEQLRAFGFSVLAIDYRGFGKSEGGLPSEDTVYEDARVAWERLAELQPDPARRFIYGHSLGGAVAIDLAAKLSTEAEQSGKPAAARGLIVESSFTTLADIARSLTYPWLPVQLILSQKFDSVDKIGRVRMPVLIVHGAGDRFVPSRFSQALYEAAPEPKKLLLVDGASHNNSSPDTATTAAAVALAGTGTTGTTSATRSRCRGSSASASVASPSSVAIAAVSLGARSTYQAHARASGVHPGRNRALRPPLCTTDIALLTRSASGVLGRSYLHRWASQRAAPAREVADAAAQLGLAGPPVST